MMFKKLALVIFVSLFIGNLNAQENLNDYKYVVVPITYDFLKEVDQYQLNSLSKFLFEKYGFVTIMENESKPNDLSRNNCLALNSNVVKESGMFNTKLKIELTNCRGDIIFTSKVGQSREKAYRVAYNKALREAFSSFNGINYSYTPNDNLIGDSVLNEDIDSKKEIEKLKEEIKTLKETKKKETVELTPIKEPIKEVIVKEDTKTLEETEDNNVLYAQNIKNGFQLVDNSPKVVYVLKNTGLSDVFLVKGKQAIIYKQDGIWLMEYYEGETLKQKQLNIKF